MDIVERLDPALRHLAEQARFGLAAGVADGGSEVVAERVGQGGGVGLAGGSCGGLPVGADEETEDVGVACGVDVLVAEHLLGDGAPLTNLSFLGVVDALTPCQDIGLLLYRASAADTAELLGLCASGAIRPAIDLVLPLAETGEALRRIGDGKVLGKVIVAVAA